MINVDTPREAGTLAGWSQVNGWAVDTLEAPLASGISEVQVYIDGEAGAGGRLLGIPTLGNKPSSGNLPSELLRTDVDQALSRSNNRSGWVLWYDFNTVTPGAHSLVVYAETVCGWRNMRVNFTVQAGGPTTPPAQAAYYLSAPGISGGAPYAPTTSTASTAQPYNPYAASPAGLVVRVERVPEGGVVSGTRTFVGVAIDCNTFQGATRVRAYDQGTTYGSGGTGQYLGDATLGGSRNISNACPMGSQYSGNYYAGGYNAGFSIPIDTTRLASGQHTLAFVADFANGSATDTLAVQVDNSGCYNNNNNNYYSGYNTYNSGNNYCYGGSSYNRYSYAQPYYNNAYANGGYGQYCLAYGSVTGRCLVYSSTPTNYLNNCNVPYPTLYGGATYPTTGVPVSSPYYTGSVVCYPGMPGCYGGAYTGNPYAYTSNLYGGAYAGNPYAYAGSTSAYYNCPAPPPINTGGNLYTCIYYPQLCANNVTNTITLAQANTTVPRSIVPLTGTVACALVQQTYPNLGGASTVTIMDVTTTGTPLTIGSVTSTNGTYLVNWNTMPPVTAGPHILSVQATGSCGTSTQQFTVTVAAP